MSAATMNADPLLDSHEAAAFLGVGYDALRAWRSRKSPGSRPFIRLGDGPCAPVRYRRSELVAYLERQTTFPG